MVWKGTPGASPVFNMNRPRPGGGEVRPVLGFTDPSADHATSSAFSCSESGKTVSSIPISFCANPPSTFIEDRSMNPVAIFVSSSVDSWRSFMEWVINS